MDDSLDLQTTYRAILNAARQGKYVSYGALAKANGAEWAKVRYKLNNQLGEIMTLAARRDWPIPSAIVVDQANLETGTLSVSATKGFVGAARELGFDVQDPQTFIAEQQQAMFAWAEGAPDELGPPKPYLDHPLNTILYGPPGTGKTYATFQRCVEFCGSTVGGKTPEAIHERYRKLVEEGRVEFVTFHQSYGYEEFVEGLRPETEGDGGGFRLKVRDGVLKRIAKRARSTPAVHTRKRKFVKIQLSEQDVFEECMKDDCVRFGPSKNWSDEDWSDARHDTYDGCLNRFEERWGQGSKRFWNATSAATFRAWVNRGDIVVVPDGYSKSKYRAVGEIVGDYEYARRSSSPLWPHRRAVRWHWRAKGNPSPVRDFQDKGFGGQLVHELRPSRPDILLQNLQQDRQRQPYVLVIDEINRANIAKVLGELITLLEEDKREGAENELAVTLPHSNERFTLPPNLHVLGTMNTADRSIALLDTALRRRFVFEEITPEPALLTKAGESAGVKLPAVLRAMNDRLEWLVGRDHLIGHAWFLKANSREAVDEVMRRKVIPLIAEYFYDDWEKVRAVLGGTDAFVQGAMLEPPPDLDGGGEKRNRWTVREHFPEGAYEELIAGGKS